MKKVAKKIEMVRTEIRLKKTLRKKIEVMMKKESQSMSQLVNQIIEAFFRE
jgi:metal-responsive CopG/Arc/MetJ family transcriptional regulator